MVLINSVCILSCNCGFCSHERCGLSISASLLLPLAIASLALWFVRSSLAFIFPRCTICLFALVCFQKLFTDSCQKGLVRNPVIFTPYIFSASDFSSEYTNIVLLET